MNFRFWTRTFWSDIGYGLGSSRYLVRRIVTIANIQNANTIVELGAGYGQVTEYLIKHKHQSTRLIVVENDPERVKELKRKYSAECEIYEMSATHIADIVSPESVDVVISTLPLGSISSLGVHHILREIQIVLRQGGGLIQFQYALQNLKDVKKYFSLDRIFFEPRNFWPAFIYRVYKK